jgi:hypothetical protein
MEKVKSNSKRLGKDQIITIIKTLEKMHDRIMLLQEAYMKEQQSLFHEKWKVRHLTRVLKQVSPEHALSEEELDQQIHRKEN